MLIIYNTIIEIYHIIDEGKFSLSLFCVNVHLRCISITVFVTATASTLSLAFYGWYASLLAHIFTRVLECVSRVVCYACSEYRNYSACYGFMCSGWPSVGATLSLNENV